MRLLRFLEEFEAVQTAPAPDIPPEKEMNPVKRTHSLSSLKILEKNTVMNKINIAGKTNCL